MLHAPPSPACEQASSNPKYAHAKQALQLSQLEMTSMSNIDASGKASAILP